MFFSENEGYDIEDITFSINESYGKQTSSSPKKILLLLFIFFALCLVFGSCIALSHRNRHDDPEKDSSNLLSHNRLMLNESETLDGLECSVKSFMFARHNGNLKYMDMAADGLVNCAIYVTVENTTKQQIKIGAYHAILVCDGKEYSQLVWEDPEFLFFQSEIPAETEWIEKVVDFQVPKEIQGSEASIDLYILSPSGQKAIWTLR